MSAYLIYSQDPYLCEIFLENQIVKDNPEQVLRYSLKKNNFKDIASRIFNFSLFEGKTLYFLENVETLNDSEIAFLSKLDFEHIQDIFIFHLQSKVYWKLLPKWENIKGLEIKELKLYSQSTIKNYLEKVVAKSISPKVINYIIQIYQKNQNFKEIVDSVLKVSLFFPEAKEIDLDMLQEFLGVKEPAQIKYLYQSLKQRNLKQSLETVFELKEKGYKEEQILLSLTSRLAFEANPQESEFLIALEKNFKIGKGNISLLLFQLIFFYSQPEVLEGLLSFPDLKLKKR